MSAMNMKESGTRLILDEYAAAGLEPVYAGDGTTLVSLSTGIMAQTPQAAHQDSLAHYLGSPFIGACCL